MEAITRPAVRRDLDALGALKLRASLAWGEHVDEIQSLPEARIVPLPHLPFIIVAEALDRLVGFATVLPTGEDHAELDDLFVEPELWGRGIGRALVAEAESKAQDIGARTLQVVANDRALGFYRACGFAVTGEVQTRFAPALRMEKHLAR